VTDFVVAVTGGARGIGLATARAFAEAGARVVVGDVDLAQAEESASAIGARAVHLDVRDAASFEAFAAAAGDIDVLVNNAGVAHGASFLDTAAELRDLQIDVNLRGVVHGMATVLPGMVERGRGHVVNVASLAGRLATPNAAVYTATKFAVLGLTEAVRAELHGSGVHATAVLPTFIHTDMTAGLPLDRIPTAEPQDVAKAILRVVRRGGPAVVAVPRWMGGLPRMAMFTPQIVQDWIRQSASGRVLDDPKERRAAYVDRVRGLIPRRPGKIV
jgi:NAD(P)-dependent dehydrogenase (short-subunit alcohol dehydrogenase family)